MLPNLTVEADDSAKNVADSVEIAKEALVLPKTEANEADDSKEEIANEADDSVEIANVADDSKEEIVNVADDSRGRRGCTSGARVPKGLGKRKPEVIFYYVKSART